MKALRTTCWAFLLGGALFSQAQQKPLPEAKLFQGSLPVGIVEAPPQLMGWLDETRMLLNRRPHPDSPTRTVIHDCRSGQEQPGSLSMLRKNSTPRPQVYLREDELWLRDTTARETKLTNTAGTETNPTLSPDGQWVAFTRRNDLYSIHLASRQEYRLTHDGTDLILNGYASWVYFEEILGRPSRYRSFWWSPDSRRIAYMRMDDTRVPLFPLFDENGTHGSLENTRYPKPGDPNPEVRIGMVDAAGGPTQWADFDPKADQYFGMPYWRPDGKALWVQWMNRGQDQLRIFEVNPANGSKKLLLEERQQTWVDLDDQGSRIRFLASGKGFILHSDQDGWENLYWHAMDGSRKNPITSDRFWSTTILSVDEARNKVLFTARKENSTRIDLYSASLDGLHVQRLTFGAYTHRVDLSPGGNYFVTTYSNTASPDQMALVDREGKKIRILGGGPGQDFATYALAKTEILRVQSDDGLFQLPIRITWPLDYDRTKRYPVMINIYGGPNAGTVRDGWQLTALQQAWAREGLIQVAMDHRASGHFGKTGINYMHRSLGVWELRDWITMVRWLRLQGADSTRVGISGFSYGGYMTCLALTAGAGYFTHGLAGGSVTDWRLYDTHYTERFMDTPAENPEGYREGSVMTHVGKYKGLLRIYHGTMDDNVHMQNSLQLVKILQEGRKHFEFMLYPGGRHGWGGSQSAHSTNENNAFIYRHLLGKEMPEAMRR
ncbi:MAG: S9 family peptidase [Bacteroidetes bacterium]|nr:S9 family peptidase [Bacteroidota bacterium]